jgi:hypothetical protein
MSRPRWMAVAAIPVLAVPAAALVAGGKAIEVPGFTGLDQGGGGSLAQVSCYSAGNCVNGGSYGFPADFAGGVDEPFVASERNGHWAKAIDVPGILPPDSTLCEPEGGPCEQPRRGRSQDPVRRQWMP